MEISGLTRTLGLIGNPVEHTLSPVIHNGVSERMGISSVYVPFKVDKTGLKEAIKGAYELNILGMNVTVPHKNEVMDYLVDIDTSAKHIGAVNTLVRVEEKHGYKGYNTDMLGLRRQIKEDGIDIKNRTVVILGAGGAAKAVVYMCLLEGASKIYLLNRTVEKAESIADNMNDYVRDGVFSYKDLSDIVIPMQMSDYKQIEDMELIVFQATSIGLHPHNDDVVIDDPGFYEKISLGIDLIYNPAETRFIKLVNQYGGKGYNALKMLLYQGIIAYELWHDITVSKEIIDEIYIKLKQKVYPNIVLIGFMGSGKSTVGKYISDEYGMDFIDTDTFIEERAGKSISQIFADEGEATFRKIETDTLAYLNDNLYNAVIATGGGMPLRPENAKLLKEIGKVYYLFASEKTIYERVKDDHTRPLLQCEDPFNKICELMGQRRPVYEAVSDMEIDTDEHDMPAIINIIKGS